MCIMGFTITGNFIVCSPASNKNTKENNMAPHYWFPLRRNQQRPMESPHKGPAMWKAFIMQFQYFRCTYDGKTHFTQQWKHMHVLGFHLTDNCIVYSTIHTEKMQENVNISHNWFFLRRIHWWPMESPHQGPTKRKTLMCNSRSLFASSILCNISKISTIVTSWRTPQRASNAINIHHEIITLSPKCL